MKKLKNLLLLLIITLVTFSISCSKINKYEETFNSFKEKWIDEDFEAMYSMLNQSSKEYIDEEAFISRYKTIYSAINLTDVEITSNGDPIKNEGYYTIPFTFKANTIAGELKLTDFNLNIYKVDKDYLIDWDESLILPNMIEGDKLYVRNFNHTRGKILGRTVDTAY